MSIHKIQLKNIDFKTKNVIGLIEELRYDRNTWLVLQKHGSQSYVMI